ncbi:MAG: hypothetical protein PUK72_07035 [Oscillospiraceae bacterium]|nr:hypothetical protein [Oscillospiraceae bacterium]
MKKRILSILLALAVLVSLVPLTAYAGTGTVKEVSTQQELVYALADASTDTLKLASDITVDAVLNVERKVTLDLKHKRVEPGTVLKSPLFAVTASKSLARDSIASFFPCTDKNMTF